jgi:EmrB/QacA subfamily drug resistance transporter
MQADPRRWKALAVVCAAFFMTILDVSIVNVALPSIKDSLHFSADNLQWVLTAYAITYGGFLLLAGRIADLFGRRRVFVIGVIVFSIASLFCGLSWNEASLITARAVQGIGAAIITPSALSIVMTTFEEGAERNKALGIWGALGGGGAAVGVLAGGVLTKYAGWEWIFYVNVPVGAIALALTPRFVRESRAERETSQDLGGAITVTSGLALLVYAVSKAPDYGWSSGRTLGTIAGAVALLLAFLAIESRTKDPLMPFRIFRIHTVAGANVSGLLLGGIIFANFYLLTLYVQQVLGYSPLRTGATFAVTAGSAILWAGVAQNLTTRFGVKPVLAIGFIGLTAANLWYTQIPTHGSFASALLGPYLVMGFAIPFAFIPISIAALAGVSHDEAGLASGLINSAQQIGGAVGTAVCSSVLLTHFIHLQKQGKGFAEAYTSGTSWAFWVLVGLSVAAFVAGATLIRRDELTPAEAGEEAEAFA